SSKASALNDGQFQQLKNKNPLLNPDLSICRCAYWQALVQFKKISRHWQGEVLAVETQLHRASCF
ncbi:hypothetical protein ALP71_102680, partial [Pseudomonas coronafaciens pv. garcae]